MAAFGDLVADLAHELGEYFAVRRCGDRCVEATVAVLTEIAAFDLPLHRLQCGVDVGEVSVGAARGHQCRQLGFQRLAGV